MTRLKAVFKLDKKGFNLRRAASLLPVALVPLVVLGVLGQEKYFVTMIFAVLFLGASDPGGEYGYRVSHMAVFTVLGARC